MMKRLVFLLIPILLGGCAAGMNDDFSCSAIDGIEGCVSMTDINTLVDQGQFTTDSQGNVLGKSQVAATTNKNVGIIEVAAPTRITDGMPMALAYPNRPTRQQERVQEITVFPYIDNAGNYHATSRIFTVITPSRWVHQQ
ncbi:type IV conjugative transfer system lipoprotein TraV [Photobacterium damselae subsp. damselae]|uniref:Type IV conjugative transfer system lipoprotein TraV n=2 Tax=Photobacterium damselae TaxID=38293 RepID=A0AAD3WYJ2_PHODD|nr:type IV conjugative transfer system lipoprotein TraV [Photobacterium damselae subsp. damselae]